MHCRILEKYKDFTTAFRRFDKNFDGSLNFREITTSLAEIGMQLSLPDYRLLFELIDYNEAGEIDFFKFTLLDYDKGAIREKLKADYQRSLLNKTAAGSESKEDEGGQHKLFRDGNIPKNKDMNFFVNSITGQSDSNS